MKDAKVTITVTKEDVHVEGEGTSFDLFELNLLAVRGMYTALKDNNKDLAEKFKGFIIDEGDKLFMSDDELKVEHEKLVKEKEKDLEEIKDVINTLGEMLKQLKG